MSKKWVAVSAIVAKLTEKAVLLQVDMGRTEDEDWVPLSQVREPDILEEGMEDIVEVRDWIADRNGWR